MRFKKVYAIGGHVKDADYDFVTRYDGENGSVIDVVFLTGNESYREYRVNGGHCYRTLKAAKAACEE